MNLRDCAPASLALRQTLRDSAPAVRIGAAKSLGRFHDVGGNSHTSCDPAGGRMLEEPDRRTLVEAVAEIGGPECIMLLNDMLRWRYRSNCGLELNPRLDGRSIFGASCLDPLIWPTDSHPAWR
jgi:hypothetical protein